MSLLLIPPERFTRFSRDAVEEDEEEGDLYVDDVSRVWKIYVVFYMFGFMTSLAPKRFTAVFLFFEGLREDPG